ncbi:MAG: magnesium protoporphyrin IX methyltransferase [Bosea sp. (in: a-proteobacteria)]|jgi:magnesium-protoporphyrin O-methyltransferase|uniref:magnesium protoporphyrin IX methyltransferase n=1 Tax=unclassified Bosea (in: a-proteobacteria) TaxID=2653178 RepID=UPI00083D324B|nr:MULTISPECIES: magnesium protoporphyrin IX methyltransferase [unclassified Bosea (in: a-proteobacteria)]AOG05373.1 magnesium protoporphyrin O-methyltransferase [Bosea sp. RAC05]MCZ8044236.1 magnesium protoporphyrin IX methyltransferase [Beijerinckiaceae bacterium]MDP3603109.1 magnesium protoporphyrin IX methyltransferase [Bosea sp. (in: a-proteobacteria)]WRH60498.1 MAG: magnesium protoporphyrin IX methyltransferase [Bosea sp. (in: a-proteobacteria)]
MSEANYVRRRSELQTYFDRTAVDAWARLTTDAPVSGIRATVRAGRDAMRNKLLAWLPQDIRGARILDAGCGTGALAVECALRGAHVTAIDLSPTLVALAQDRSPRKLCGGSISFRTGDMLDPALGRFDHVVAMDSLIHYKAADIVAALARLAERTSGSMLVTHAPRTPALTLMHWAGLAFPRADRAPAIEPVSTRNLASAIAGERSLSPWRIGRSERVSSAFYKSQALELVAR